MIIASVRFRLRPGTNTDDLARLWIESSAPRHRKVPGLITKHYVLGNGQGGGIYVWESREMAERLYTPEWKAHVTERFGGAPEIEWLDSPVAVDNANGRIVTAPAQAA